MILFCLPYAGGSEAIFYKWKDFLDPKIEFCPIELKGRGKRIGDGAYENIEEAVEDVFNNMKEKITDSEYAIFGHSLGSLLAFELYYKISEKGMRRPKHIFFSGCKDPSCESVEEKVHNLPNEVFIDRIIQLDGTPEELKRHKEILAMFVPMLRSDFKICETYKYTEKKEKIKCDISLLNGIKDPNAPKDGSSWEKYSCREIKSYIFQGNHFFINNSMERITEIVNDTLV
ncbi:thioesterase II family protein [Clostridium tunisiense]|uniref:thioesterase II family protein n=1 Tax=Clostridium tunisiense TaxID=219748 RepID=UPI0002DCCAE3|nr:thioesterase domain-containing protein [Clostridium tunisiense]